MNLYIVWDKNYEWCCYAFDTTRNRAKLRVAESFGEDYINMRCKTLRKGINLPYPMLADSEDAEGYDIVLQLGYRYATEEEMNELYL